VFSDILSRAELRADAIHPNAEGYRRMAEGLFEQLKEVGLVPAR
jgi:acyl-CoA hydrolase